MKKLNPTVITLTLLLTFLAVCASANGWIGLPLPAVVLVGLGAHAAYLLWEHRAKMSAILGPRAQVDELVPPAEANDLHKAA
jgi:hypothetical protein